MLLLVLSIKIRLCMHIITAVSIQIQPIEYFILFYLLHGVQSLCEFYGVHYWLIIQEYDN